MSDLGESPTLRDRFDVVIGRWLPKLQRPVHPGTIVLLLDDLESAARSKTYNPAPGRDVADSEPDFAQVVDDAKRSSTEVEDRLPEVAHHRGVPGIVSACCGHGTGGVLRVPMEVVPGILAKNPVRSPLTDTPEEQ